VSLTNLSLRGTAAVAGHAVVSFAPALLPAITTLILGTETRTG
jgi:hypothetical protein